MPITFGQDVPQINYAEYDPPDPEVKGSVFGAAFRLENDVVNLINYMSQPTFAPDPTFDPMERAKSSLFFMNSPDSFVNLKSGAEWDYMEAKLAKEFQDRALIEQAGWGGVAAAMTAGVLSPTIFIPMGAVARAPTVASAAIRGGALTAFGVGVQEGVLHLNQETRTGTESAIAIGGAAVIGSLLGSAIRYLDPLQIEKMGSDMATIPGGQAISRLYEPPPSVGKPEGLSAQAVDQDAAIRQLVGIDPGGLAPGVGSLATDRVGMRDKFNFSWMGPITRGLTSEFSGRRMLTAQFGSGGVLSESMLRGEVAAEEGVLEQVVKQYQAKYAIANREVQSIFREWHMKNGGSKTGAYMNVRSMKDFSELVGEGLFHRIQGKPGDLPPEVMKAADVYFTQLFEPVLKEAQYAGLPPFGRLSDQYAQQMVTQKVSRLKAANDYQEVQKIIYENALEQLRKAKLKSDELDSQGMLQRLVNELPDAPRKKVAGAAEDARLTLAQLDEAQLDYLAELISEELMQKHLSNGLRHGAIDILQNIGEKEAKYVYIDPTRKWSNGRTWGEFLEKDIEVLGRSFMRSMGPDIELYRRFKVNFRSDQEFSLTDKKIRSIPAVEQFMKEVKEAREAAAKLPEKERTKRNAAIAREEQEFINDMNVLIGRLRHTWGQPADPTHIGHRMGKGVLQLNTMRLMGSVVLSSLPDLARPVLKYGFMTTMRQGVLPMLRNFKEFRLLAKEAQYAGEALDLMLHGRTTAMADLFEEDMYAGSLIERAMQYGTSRIGIIALFDYWNTGLKNFSGALLNAEVMRVIEALDAGKLSKKDEIFLAGLNIKQADARKIGDIVRSNGGTRTSSGAWLPNTEDWLKVPEEDIRKRAATLMANDPKAKKPTPGKKLPTAKGSNDKTIEDYLQPAKSELLKERQRLLRVYRSAIAQGVSDTIITPGLERPNWVDASTLGRLIGQFRSFTLSSTFKVGLRASQDIRAGNMAPIMAGTMFSLALGMLSYYTWAHTVGGRTKERMLNELDDALNGDEQAMARWADEAITRSGLLGVFAEAQKFAERTPGLAPYATFAGVPPARSPYLNPATELLGPWMSAVQNVGRIAVTADDPTSETFRAAKQLVPYQNVFYLRQMFDSMNEMAMDAAGVPYQ